MNKRITSAQTRIYEKDRKYGSVAMGMFDNIVNAAGCIAEENCFEIKPFLK